MMTPSDAEREARIAGRIPHYTDDGAAADVVFLRRLLDEARVEIVEWQLITDAQRDGELYLLSKPGSRRSGPGEFVGYWDDRADGWYAFAGAYVISPAPTHWMPVPKPPKR